MTRLDALRALLDKVEAGAVSAADADLIHAAFGRWVCGEATIYLVGAIMNNTLEAMGAAKALHEAALPRHYAQAHMWPMPEMCRVDIGGRHSGRADNPAIAWLISILRALIAQEEAKV